jgi:hypothetical protein
VRPLACRAACVGAAGHQYHPSSCISSCSSSWWTYPPLSTTAWSTRKCASRWTADCTLHPLKPQVCVVSA